VLSLVRLVCASLALDVRTGDPTVENRFRHANTFTRANYLLYAPVHYFQLSRSKIWSERGYRTLRQTAARSRSQHTTHRDTRTLPRLQPPAHAARYLFSAPPPPRLRRLCYTLFCWATQEDTILRGGTPGWDKPRHAGGAGRLVDRRYCRREHLARACFARARLLPRQLQQNLSAGLHLWRIIIAAHAAIGRLRCRILSHFACLCAWQLSRTPGYLALPARALLVAAHHRCRAAFPISHITRAALVDFIENKL